MTDGPTTPTPPPGGMPGAPAPSLVERAKNIILSPKTEWPRIDAEPATIGGIYTSYVMILAAIGPVAMLIGHQLVGITVLGTTYKPSIGYSVGSAVLNVLSLAFAVATLLAVARQSTRAGAWMVPSVLWLAFASVLGVAAIAYA